MARALIPANLGQLRRPPGWVWVYCARYVPPCQHRADGSRAPHHTWGPDASSDMLRRCTRSTVCGHKARRAIFTPQFGGPASKDDPLRCGRCRLPALIRSRVATPQIYHRTTGTLLWRARSRGGWTRSFTASAARSDRSETGACSRSGAMAARASSAASQRPISRGEHGL